MLNTENSALKQEQDDVVFEATGIKIEVKTDEEETKYYISSKHHGKEKVNHICPHCGKSYSAKGNMQTHISTVHEGSKSFECEECGKRFGQKGTLKLHKKTVHDLHKEFVCEICAKPFPHKQTLLFP